MKLLFVLLVVAAAAMADPEESIRERRGLLGAPLLAPRAIIAPALAPAILAPAPAVKLIAPAPILAAAAPWGKAVLGPSIWG